MLKDKSVVVTGSAKGIGRYIAHRFAQEGAKVTIADVDEARLQQTVGELGEMGAEAMAVPTDVTSEDSVASLMAQVNERFGGIDVLVNDAAIVPHFAWGDKPRWPKVQDMEVSFFWDTVMGVALRGTFLASKHAVPYMEKGGSGHVVNLHGGGGLTPPGALAYATAKDSLITFTKFHAEEVRDSGICVVIISPGRRSPRRTRRTRRATACRGRITQGRASCSARRLRWRCPAPAESLGRRRAGYRALSMFDVTEAARQQLKNVVEERGLAGGKLLRLAVPPVWTGAGDWGIVIDDRGVADVAYAHESTTVLIIEHEVAEALGSSVLDYKTEGVPSPRFTLDIYSP